MIEEHLALAQRHVMEGEGHVQKQRDIVAELERDGHDTTQARELLRTFEELLGEHYDDRARLEFQLAESTRVRSRPKQACGIDE